MLMSLRTAPVALLFVALSAPCALADSRTPGHAGKPGQSVPAEAAALPPTAEPMARQTFDPRKLRTRLRSADDARKAFTLVGRTRDGKEVKEIPGDEVIRAIIDGASATDKRGTADDVKDPTDRVVVGRDSRVRVTTSEDYPYSAIGYLGFEEGSAPGTFYFCTAGLIASRIIITAAHCLYSHTWEPGGQGDAWNDHFEFWPGINGDDNQPYGSVVYDTAYVFEGWMSEYDGTWDSVAQFDIGLITLAEPIGDSTGHLGYWTFGDDADGLDAYVVGYDLEKSPSYSMWRSRCVIAKADLLEQWFIHDCDTSATTVGPIFVYDAGEDQRYVVGVDLGETADGRNAALRLYGAVYEWISSLDQQ